MSEIARIANTKWLRRAVAAGLVLAYGYWLTDLEPFSASATRALFAAVVVLVGVAETRRFRRRVRPAVMRGATMFRVAVVAWSALAIAVTTWELLALRGSPRSQHPTISSLVESVEQYHFGRLALFCAWLWLGWTLAS